MITPARSRALAILTIAAVAALGLPTTVAAAAGPSTPGTVPLEGVIRVLPNEEGMNTASGTHATENMVTLVTEEGTAVELTGAKIDDAETGSTFSGVVTVVPKVAALVEAAPATELGEQVAQAAAELEVPLKVTAATLAPAASPAAAARAHTVDVMVFRASSTGMLPAPSDADIDTAVTRLSEYWASESGGQITGFTRPNAVKRALVSEAELCDANTLWDYAAGSKGFNRDYFGNTSLASAHYWAKGNGEHLLVLVQGSICGEGNGLGTIGSVHAGGLSWASVSTNQNDWDQVVFHELGHNLGLGHSNLTQCSLPAVEGDACTQQEYYDFYDVMGGGIWWGNTSNFANIGALNASQKVNLDALTRTGSTPGIQTVTADGGPSQTFTLQGAGTGSGLRALDVVNQHTGEHYYVEYRSGTGRDAQSFYGRVGKTERTWAPGVRVLKLDCANPSEQLCGGKASTVLRNSQTGSLSFQPGQQFESITTGAETPGLRVAVDAASTSTQTATVTVSFDGTATPPVELAEPVITGTAKVGYTLTASVEQAWDDEDYELRWVVGGVDIEHVGANYELQPADVGKTVEVWGVIEGGDRGILKSAPTAPVAKGDLPSFTLSLSGAAVVDGSLASDGVTRVEGSKVLYRWMADGATISGATAGQYSPRAADLYKRVSVQATVTLAGYNDRVVTSPASPPIAAAKISAGTPSIYGTPTVGKTLTADPSYWTDGTIISYQWNANGVKVAGATRATHTVAPAHAGQQMTVTVTGVKPGYTVTSRTSPATVPVDKGWLTSVQPSIQGVPKVGNTLTAYTEPWAERPALTFQWNVDGFPVAGATGVTFLLEPKHAGTVVTLDVTGTLAGYYSHSRTSSAGVIAPATLSSSTPTISGGIKVGSRLTASPGAWTGGTSFRYQWLAGGAVISGATGTTFTPTASHVGKTISVRVTGSKLGYTTVTKTSAAVTITLSDLAYSTPTVSGTAKVGVKLTAKPGTWSAGVRFTYQWYANGAAISRATGSTYTPGAAQAGKTISVKVTGSKAGYQTVAKVSKATGKVAKGTFKVAAPKVSGTGKAGAKHTATLVTKVSGARVTYQWYSNGRAIKGATKSTYVATRADRGKSLTVKATYAVNGYVNASATSARKVIR